MKKLLLCFMFALGLAFTSCGSGDNQKSDQDSIDTISVVDTVNVDTTTVDSIL
jgi:hypothetical protein